MAKFHGVVGLLLLMVLGVAACESRKPPKLERGIQQSASNAIYLKIEGVDGESKSGSRATAITKAALGDGGITKTTTVYGVK